MKVIFKYLPVCLCLIHDYQSCATHAIVRPTSWRWLMYPPEAINTPCPLSRAELIYLFQIQFGPEGLSIYYLYTTKTLLRYPIVLHSAGPWQTLISTSAHAHPIASSHSIFLFSKNKFHYKYNSI